MVSGPCLIMLGREYREERDTFLVEVSHRQALPMGLCGGVVRSPDQGCTRVQIDPQMYAAVRASAITVSQLN